MSDETPKCCTTEGKQRHCPTPACCSTNNLTVDTSPRHLTQERSPRKQEEDYELQRATPSFRKYETGADDSTGDEETMKKEEDTPHGYMVLGGDDIYASSDSDTINLDVLSRNVDIRIVPSIDDLKKWSISSSASSVNIMGEPSRVSPASGEGDDETFMKTTEEGEGGSSDGVTN